jgi:pimeloyl-ACP methyl ester carboxylesterase
MEPLPLPSGIRSRYLEDVNGLTVHILEAGFDPPGRPCVLLLHGFPELAYSWRKQLLSLAEEGYHVIAPDQRGYGRTTGWEAGFDRDLASYRTLNLVRDALGVVAATGHKRVEAVVGHDFGSPVAAWCSVVRPDIFRRVVMMSAPYAGPPRVPFGTRAERGTPGAPDTAPGPGPLPFLEDPIHQELARLQPPRKHYQCYYSGPEANQDMWHCRQGVHAFLRAYFHVKSADWPENHPHRLSGWQAEELAKLPEYYVMPLHKGMAETLAPYMPSASQISKTTWLTDPELRVFAQEFERTGFQGGLSKYRAVATGRFTGELQLYAGRTIDVPALFVAGASDWGVYQKPGSFEAMQNQVCTDFRGAHLIAGAGHWVQQEQPEAVASLLEQFLRETRD